MAETLDSPDIVWKTAKSFIGWKSTGTPTQLKVNGLVMLEKGRLGWGDVGEMLGGVMFGGGWLDVGQGWHTPPVLYFLKPS